MAIFFMNNHTRHKVFVSYHHANDQCYRDRFEELFAGHHEIMLSNSVQDGDIDENLPAETIRQKIRDEYLRDSTVTVVLIGTETWKRKHVDWEIGTSLRATKHSSRSGLLGILLPTYPGYKERKCNPYTIPPRLFDNLENKFATLHLWNENPATVQQWIHDAFERRNEILPDNSRASFGRNLSGTAWTD